MGGIKKWLLGALSVLTLCAVSVGASACGGENGANGKDGKDGADGKSAYQIWLDNGHTGTEADFLEWLKGDGVSSAESLQYQRISGKDEYRVIGLGTVSSLDIEIPATYKGLPVTEIGASAFEEQIYLESVTIGNGVTNIGHSAFKECESLTSVTIGDGVTTIDSSAFGGCSMTEIVIPDSVTSIGSGAFEYCKSLTIYCEAESQPSGWENNWNGGCTVEWGYKETA